LFFLQSVEDLRTDLLFEPKVRVLRSSVLLILQKVGAVLAESLLFETKIGSFNLQAFLLPET
jgi:hypothetical protein